MKPSAARLTGGCWNPARISGTSLTMVAGFQLEFQVQGEPVVTGVQLKYRVQGSGCWSPARISGTRQ